jgi:Fic family protein
LLERAGKFESRGAGSDAYSVFSPALLPASPPLRIDAHLQDRLERASHALGKLDGVALMLPDPGLFLWAYIRKEAVLSSQIEGTQPTRRPILHAESPACSKMTGSGSSPLV